MAVRFYQLVSDAAEDLRATLAGVGQGDAARTVLADPEGNEFRILGPHASPVH